jgi:hypothetical protein
MPLRALRVPLVALCLLVAAGWQAAAAAPGPSRVATATPRDGVRLIGDLRVGPLASSSTVSTLVDVRAVWGPEATLRHCVAGWGTGVRLLFTSFGGASSCEEDFLQQAKVVGPRWKVRIGRRTWAIGDPRSSIPDGARLIPYQGYVLATMPFIGSRTPTVMAHVDRDDHRIDRFTLFIGGAGD